MWRFEQRRLYIGSLGANSCHFPYQMSYNPQWTDIESSPFKPPHWLQVYTKHGNLCMQNNQLPTKTLVELKGQHLCMQNNQRTIIGDQLPTKSPIELKNNPDVHTSSRNAWLKLDKEDWGGRNSYTNLWSFFQALSSHCKCRWTICHCTHPLSGWQQLLPELVVLLTTAASFPFLASWASLSAHKQKCWKNFINSTTLFLAVH